MPAWLAALPWVKIAAVAAVVTGLGLFYWHYSYLTTEAAKVPALEKANVSLTAQVQTNDKRIGPVLEQMKKNNDDVVAALTDLNHQRAQFNLTIANLKEAMAHASASTNPVCRPSDAERKLWNDTIAKYFADSQPGSTGAAGKVP